MFKIFKIFGKIVEVLNIVKAMWEMLSNILMDVKKMKKDIKKLKKK